PPIMGAAAFLMAEFLEIPYLDVAAAALLPALLYYVSVFVQVDLIAGRDAIAGDRDERLTVRAVLADGWHFLIPLAVLLLALFHWRLDPEDSALIASVAILVVGFGRGYRGERLTPGKLGRVFVETGVSMVDLILVVAAAGFVIGVLNITGLGFALTLVLVNAVGSSPILLLLISALVCTVLGMGMPTSGVYVLLAALVAPALVQAGIHTIAAHMFILYFGMMSMITPPVALAAFAAATISKADPLGTGLAALRVGWAAFIIPFIFVSTPALLLDGGLADIALAVAVSVLGITAITIGIVGYWGRGLDVLPRAAFLALGLFALPMGFLPVSMAVHGFSAAAIVVLAIIVKLRNRAPARSHKEETP
ncbi:MAG: TRAP transporter large permease subunit, partial [Rhodobacterales bacterium]|nr:TRAP transporter large permease subunit [Rhodobacterales bacterium]